MSIDRNDAKVLLVLAESGGVVSNKIDVLNKLQKGGYIDSVGHLTANGILFVERMKDVLSRLKAGILYGDRKPGNPLRMIKESPNPFWTGSAGGRQVTTNNHILYVGAPHKSMKAKLGRSDLRRQIASVLAKYNKGIYQPASPVFYQTDGDIGGEEAVYLQSAEMTRQVVQAKYFDFIVSKWPTSTFLVSADSAYMAIKVQLHGKGITNDHIVAWVMPFLVEWPEPMSAKEEVS